MPKTSVICCILTFVRGVFLLRTVVNHHQTTISREYVSFFPRTLSKSKYIGAFVILPSCIRILSQAMNSGSLYEPIRISWFISLKSFLHVTSCGFLLLMFIFRCLEVCLQDPKSSGQLNFGLLEILIKRYKMAVKGNYYWRYTHFSLSPMILGGRLKYHQLG